MIYSPTKSAVILFRSPSRRDGADGDTDRTSLVSIADARGSDGGIRQELAKRMSDQLTPPQYPWELSLCQRRYRCHSGGISDCTAGSCGQRWRA
jgi:hypothetical protein